MKKMSSNLGFGEVKVKKIEKSYNDEINKQNNVT